VLRAKGKAAFLFDGQGFVHAVGRGVHRGEVARVHQHHLKAQGILTIADIAHVVTDHRFDHVVGDRRACVQPDIPYCRFQPAVQVELSQGIKADLDRREEHAEDDRKEDHELDQDNCAILTPAEPAQRL